MATILDLPVTRSIQTKPVIYFLSTVVVVNILFFIDEGYYDFRWMADLGNWLAFAIYFAVLFLAQFGLDRLLSAIKTPAKVSISIVIGSMAGLLFLVFGVFG